MLSTLALLQPLIGKAYHIAVTMLDSRRSTRTTIGRRNNERSKKRIPIVWVINGTIGLVILAFVWGNMAGMSALQGAHSAGLRIPRRVRSTLDQLRHYPPHRFYKIGLPINQQPDFLTSTTEYVHGEFPIILQTTTGPYKLAVDQSSWLPDLSSSSVLPFADGTNPSIISIDRLSEWKDVANLKMRFPDARYLATACMTNSQCAWNDPPEDIQKYKISTQDKPTTVRTVLMVLNDSFEALAQTTVYLKRDSGWGRKMKKPSDKPHLPALDDARLFLHNKLLYVSFREGPGFGYETQVLNPVHVSVGPNDGIIQAHILASETSSFCCGRNMALMKGGDGGLRALTWVDPVTIITVDTLLERNGEISRVVTKWVKT